jgi:small subunit ribosomal protein S14
MAKTSAIEKNNRRKRLSAQYQNRRNNLRAIFRNKDLPAEERYAAMAKLSELPRNSAKNRVRLRCELSGRPRGNYRKFKLSRIALRDLGLQGVIPGITKASW